MDDSLKHVKQGVSSMALIFQLPQPEFTGQYLQFAVTALMERPISF